MKLSDNTKHKLLNTYGPWGLITGASSGIGKELAKTVAEAGLNVILSGRNEEALQALSNDLETTFKIITEVIVADISTTLGIYKLIEELEDLPIGLFIASAGFGTSGEFINSNLDNEIQMLQVNTLALMMLTHYFGRKFAEQKKGGIILMSSIVGFQGVPNAANYSATKAYVQSLGEGLYHELKPYNVDVLAAAPGPVNSSFAKTANMQMGNALKPEDVAVPILKALGKKSTVFPGTLTKILILGLRTVPRWGKIRIMKMVMSGMTKHQNNL
ncbi:SDR family oxidoreductase [Flagellimonas sp. HMM57]|uniref:SDR family NAD(P)-dependent oxidoreductase n=1 Tax=unclassified Flagellimonas TaxID=2644544 RepID=UPI0013D2BF22|nr:MULTISPECIES: SDR family oxidoreductase [unclassified Flagellimonas]UII74518.1 SDR family oxidoreductase [Flagellimonas sp. HMM57]